MKNILKIALFTTLSFNAFAAEEAAKSEVKIINSEVIQELANRIPENVYWKDNNSVYLGCNDKYAASLNTDKDKIIGKKDTDFFVSDSAEQFVNNDQAVIKKTQTIVFDEEVSRIVDKNKSKVKSTKIPLRDNAGNVVGVLGVSVKIPDLKK